SGPATTCDSWSSHAPDRRAVECRRSYGLLSLLRLIVDARSLRNARRGVVNFPKFLLLSFVVGNLVPVPLAAAHSATGSMAGVARDTSGAVLPGVTVEVSSPALIEKTRSAVTDSQGNYKITELRPGTYTVTFTLQGFATYRREGIELSAGFTAPVNADL